MQYYIELVNSLKRGVVAPVYLFYGEETYLRERAVARFRDYFCQDGGAGMNYELLDGETVNPADIVASAETLPFFASKRLVVVKNPQFLSAGRAAGNAQAGAPEKEQPLLNYLERPLTSTCLIFTTGEPVDRRKKLFRLIQKNGRAIEFTLLNKAALVRWLERECARQGKKFAPEAADAFLAAAGPSLQHLVLEWEKLCHYTAGREMITLAEVRRVCAPQAGENIFAIVDAIGNKRYQEALTGIKEMLAAKEPPQRLLSLIARHFRLLLQVRDLIERDCPLRIIAGRLKLHPYYCQKIAAQCRNFDQDLLLRVFHFLSELDAAVKTGRQEFYPALETCLMKINAGYGGQNKT